MELNLKMGLKAGDRMLEPGGALENHLLKNFHRRYQKLRIREGKWFSHGQKNQSWISRLDTLGSALSILFIVWHSIKLGEGMVRN